MSIPLEKQNMFKAFLNKPTDQTCASRYYQAQAQCVHHQDGQTLALL
jgi:hypothetical protein